MKMKAALFVILMAACGGNKGKQPATTPTDETAATTTTETAKEAPPDTAKQEPPADTTGALAQAALTEQYELGKKLYTEKKCATCHEDNGAGNPKNPPVIGEKALPEQPPASAKLRKGVTFKTAKDVMDFVKAKMPIKSPGTLTDDEAAAVTAWMLSESKVNISAKLDASNAASVNLR
jgi:cytochrome c